MSFARSGVHAQKDEPKAVPKASLRVEVDGYGGLEHIFVVVDGKDIAELAHGVVQGGVKFQPGDKGSIGTWTFTFASDIDGESLHRTIRT